MVPPGWRASARGPRSRSRLRPFRVAGRGHARFVPGETAHALFEVLEAGSEAGAAVAVRFAVVGELEFDPPVPAGGAQRQVQRRAGRGDAVLEAVLDERLQQQRRNRRREHRRIAGVAELERVLVALARDAEVVLDERDLVREQRRRPLSGLDGVAQHVGEPFAEALRGRRIGLDEIGQGVERVEQEVRLHLRLQRAQLGARRRFLQLDRAALGRRARLGEAQVVEPDSGLAQQRRQLAARVIGRGLGVRQPRRALGRPDDLHLAAQAAREADLDRLAHLVAVERRQQVAAGVVEGAVQPARVAAVEPVNGALQPRPQRRERERQHERGDHAEDQRLLARHVREQPLAEKHHAQVDGREHAREQRVRQAVGDQPARIEDRVVGDQVREHERRRQPGDQLGRVQAALHRQRQEREHARVGRDDVERRAREHREARDHRQHPLVRGRVPERSRARVALDHGQDAEGERDGLVPVVDGLRRARAPGRERQPQHQRGDVGGDRDPEPRAAHTAPRPPAGAREHAHEVDERRRVEPRDPLVGAQIGAEGRRQLDLRVLVERPHDTKPLQDREPQEHPGGREIRPPPDEQERHQRRRDHGEDRVPVDAQPFPGVHLHGRHDHRHERAAARDDQPERPRRHAARAQRVARRGLAQVERVHPHQHVALAQQAPGGRPDDALDDTLRDVGAEPLVRRVGEEAGQRQRDGDAQGRHRQHAPRRGVGSHAGHLRTGGRAPTERSGGPRTLPAER